MAPPGTYQVRLTAEGKSFTAALEVKVDPRMKTSPEDLQKQNDLARQILAEVSEIHEAIGAIRDIRTQIHGLDRRLGEDSRFAQLQRGCGRLCAHRAASAGVRGVTESGAAATRAIP